MFTAPKELGIPVTKCDRDLEVSPRKLMTGHFQVTFSIVSKRVLVQKFLREDEFDLHGSERAGKTHFQMNGLTRRLVLTEAKEGNGLSITCHVNCVLHTGSNCCLKKTTL